MREFFNMRGFPTIIVLGADGVELDRMVGFGGDAEKFTSTIGDWAGNRNTIFAYLKKWAQDTTDVEWNYRIAKRYVERAQMDLAQRFFRNVLKLDPQDKAGHRQAAEFNIVLHEARNTGNPEKLAAHLETEAEKERMRVGYFSLARLYEGKPDVPAALSTYRTALEKMPDDAGLMNACAWFIYEQEASEHYPWGIEIAKKAVELEPEAASIWDTLAWLLHSNGQYREAVDAMTKVVALEPDAEYFQETLKKMKNDLKEHFDGRL